MDAVQILVLAMALSILPLEGLIKSRFWSNAQLTIYLEITTLAVTRWALENQVAITTPPAFLWNIF